MNKTALTIRNAGLSVAASYVFADAENVNVSGQAMYPRKDIADNAVNSAEHTMLVAAVNAVGLVDMLKSRGPFTVFAPTYEAFAENSRYGRQPCQT